MSTSLARVLPPRMSFRLRVFDIGCGNTLITCALLRTLAGWGMEGDDSLLTNCVEGAKPFLTTVSAL